MLKLGLDFEVVDGGARSGVGGDDDNGVEIVESGSMPVTSSGVGPPKSRGKMPGDDVPSTPVVVPSKY